MRNPRLNRLVANGVVIGEFSVQYRSHSDITRISSFVFENNRVTSSETIRDNPRSWSIRQWNQHFLSCKLNTVIIDLNYTYAKVEGGSHSQSNQAHALFAPELGRYLLESVVKKLHAKDIAIIVPYESIQACLPRDHPDLQ